MKLATWNVNSHGVRLPQVLDWLARQPGGCCSPCKSSNSRDDKFPADAFEAIGLPRRSGSARRPTTAWPCSSRTPASDICQEHPRFRRTSMSRVITGTVERRYA